MTGVWTVDVEDGHGENVPILSKFSGQDEMEGIELLGAINKALDTVKTDGRIIISCLLEE